MLIFETATDTRCHEQLQLISYHWVAFLYTLDCFCLQCFVQELFIPLNTLRSIGSLTCGGTSSSRTVVCSKAVQVTKISRTQRLFHPKVRNYFHWFSASTVWINFMTFLLWKLFFKERLLFNSSSSIHSLHKRLWTEELSEKEHFLQNFSGLIFPIICFVFQLMVYSFLSFKLKWIQQFWIQLFRPPYYY